MTDGKQLLSGATRIFILEMKRLQCTHCEVEARPKFAWFGYEKEFSMPLGPSGKVRTRKLWLCPDCAGQFASDRARDAFLRKAWTMLTEGADHD